MELINHKNFHWALLTLTSGFMPSALGQCFHAQMILCMQEMVTNKPKPEFYEQDWLPVAPTLLHQIFTLLSALHGMKRDVCTMCTLSARFGDFQWVLDECYLTLHINPLIRMLLQVQLLLDVIPKKIPAISTVSKLPIRKILIGIITSSSQILSS